MSLHGVTHLPAMLWRFAQSECVTVTEDEGAHTYRVVSVAPR
jgi:hypothetical protein